MPNIKRVELKSKVTIEDRTILEEGFYLIFPVKGKRPEASLETWRRILAYFEDESIDERRSFSSDFEKYISEDEAEIYIGVNYL